MLFRSTAASLTARVTSRPPRDFSTPPRQAKEESELTMCTDVDRNDKSRICKEGSVSVIGRRQIEM